MLSAPELLRPAPAPRFATQRDPRFATYGPAITATAAAMGTPFMPWQRQAADVIGEVYPDGRFHHPFVVITVPRQAGKTTLVLAKNVHRCLYHPGRRVWYTAETGKKARDKWAEMLDVLEAPASPLASLIAKTKRSNGDELLRWVNGSTFNPFPPTKDGIHGGQADAADVDEGWSHDQAQGLAIMQGIAPAQATRPQRQTVVLSTMGSAASVWFHSLVDAGLGLGVDAEGTGLARPPALLYWGVPDDTDGDDLDTIAAHHPAFGYTMDMQALVDARQQLGSASEFLRAYGNLRTGARESVFPADAWRATASELVADGRPAFGVAVTEDAADAAIYAAWRLTDGRVLVELVDARAGDGWVPARLVELRQRWWSVGIAGDRTGPAGPALDAFELLVRRTDPTADPLLSYSRAAYAAACADVRGRITTEGGPTWLRRDVEGNDLDGAAGRANRRWIGDGAFVWDRRGSSGSIAELEAATHATWAAGHAPASLPLQDLITY